MHSPQLYPAGVGLALDNKSDGAWLTGEVVEPTAMRLVEKKALRAFSVGIANAKIVKDAAAPGGRIVGGDIVEVSLVDRPANPSCAFSVLKAVDGGELAWSGKVTKGDDLAASDDDNGDDSDDDGAGDSVDEDDDQNQNDDEENNKHAVANESVRGSSLGDGEGVAQPVEKDEDASRDEDKAGEDGAHAEKSSGPREDAQRADATEHSSGGGTSPKSVVKDDATDASDGKATREATYRLLLDEVNEDGGTGKEAYDIKQLAEAYSDLASFAVGEAYEAANVEAEKITKMDAGRVLWFIGKSDVSSKEQREGAKHKLTDENGDVQFPINDCNDVDDAWALRGHSSISKDKVEAYIRSAASDLGCSVSGDDTKKSRTYYRNNDKEAHMAALKQAHDVISALAPGVCDADDSDDAAATKAETATMITKADHDTALNDLQAKYDGLKGDYEKLAAAPDVTKVARKAQRADTTKRTAIEDANELAQKQQEDEYVSFLRDAAMSGSHATADAAQQVLAKMGKL